MYFAKSTNKFSKIKCKNSGKKKKKKKKKSFFIPYLVKFKKNFWS